MMWWCDGVMIMMMMIIIITIVSVDQRLGWGGHVYKCNLTRLLNIIEQGVMILTYTAYIHVVHVLHDGCGERNS